MKISRIIALLILSAGISFSKIGKIETSQLWFDARYFFFLTDSLEFVGEAGYRIDNLEHSWQKIYINPQMRWILSETWGARVGLAIHYTEETLLQNTLELRPWQGVLLYWPRTRWFKIEHYFRAEERINFTFDPNETTFDLRLRYRIGTKVPLNILSNPIYRLYIPLQLELFSAQEDKIIERYPSKNRLTFGLGFRNGLVWGIDANYIFQQSRQGETVTSSDNILRIRVRFYGFKKSQEEASE